jgi:hypothetical protein
MNAKGETDRLFWDFDYKTLNYPLGLVVIIGESPGIGPTF